MLRAAGGSIICRNVLIAVLIATAFALLLPLVTPRWRASLAIVLSLAGIGWFDPKLLVAMGLVIAASQLAMRLIGISEGRARTLWTVLALAGIGAIFVWHKTGGGGGVLPSQTGLVWVGFSYLALKLSAAIVDTHRRAHPAVPARDLVAWSVFLPTFSSGPVEPLDHFRRQAIQPTLSRSLAGLERVLFGLVKTLLLARVLGEWSQPILSQAGAHSPVELLIAAYAFTLRFYLDFAGYSDIAIGAAAIWGVEIQENFDRPLIQRNLVQLWQRWHMTLTGWLRRYLFVPISRRLLRWERSTRNAPAVVAQLTTMLVCGLWHGITPGFALWGLIQGLGLVFVGVYARQLGRRIPHRWLVWWRSSPAAHGLSVALTFNFFALANVFAVLELPRAREFFAALIGL